MKNQNDMIISVVAIVLGLIGFCIGFFTKRQVIAPAAPEAVVVTPPALQGADVKMANSLPSAGNNSNPFGSGGGGGGAGLAGGGVPQGPTAAGQSSGSGAPSVPQGPTAAGRSSN